MLDAAEAAVVLGDVERARGEAARRVRQRQPAPGDHFELGQAWPPSACSAAQQFGQQSLALFDTRHPARAGHPRSAAPAPALVVDVQGRPADERAGRARGRAAPRVRSLASTRKRTVLDACGAARRVRIRLRSAPGSTARPACRSAASSSASAIQSRVPSSRRLLHTVSPRWTHVQRPAARLRDRTRACARAARNTAGVRGSVCMVSARHGGRDRAWSGGLRRAPPAPTATPASTLPALGIWRDSGRWPRARCARPR